MRRASSASTCRGCASSSRRRASRTSTSAAMVIDCHGHYTTVPAAHGHFREAQLARLADPSLPPPARAEISDDEVRESIEHNQLRLLRERGGDLIIFSPQASAMEHHVPDRDTAVAWA